MTANSSEYSWIVQQIRDINYRGISFSKPIKLSSVIPNLGYDDSDDSDEWIEVDVGGNGSDNSNQDKSYRYNRRTGETERL